MGRSSRRKKERKEKRIELTKEQAHEFLQIVRDDLIFLKSQKYEKPSRTDVRISSSILRRLLYDQMYQMAWALAGFQGQPNIEAIDLAEMISEIDTRYINYGYAGGARTKGAQHRGYVLLAIPKEEVAVEGTEATVQQISKLIKPGERRLFTLPEFCQSPSVVSGDANVSRVGIVRYVANKLGGVHWDSERLEWSNPVGSRHRLLDDKHIMVGHLSAPLYEVISMAQDIGIAKDTEQYINRVNNIAPDIGNLENTLSFREGRTGKYADLTFKPKGSADK